MATHSSVLAWRIPRIEGPGRLQSMGSQRAGHDRSDTATCLKLISPVSFTFFFFCGTKNMFTRGAWVMYLWAVLVWRVVRPQTH